MYTFKGFKKKKSMTAAKAGSSLAYEVPNSNLKNLSLVNQPGNKLSVR